MSAWMSHEQRVPSGWHQPSLILQNVLYARLHGDVSGWCRIAGEPDHTSTPVSKSSQISRTPDGHAPIVAFEIAPRFVRPGPQPPLQTVASSVAPARFHSTGLPGQKWCRPPMMTSCVTFCCTSAAPEGEPLPPLACSKLCRLVVYPTLTIVTLASSAAASTLSSSSVASGACEALRIRDGKLSTRSGAYGPICHGGSGG
mmetsp:Transcript_3037/g.9123  ORF Transcript_3037/g.9123 Transcript_3037/m.9123 type:complete len:200 (+) Transcript_3037:137-736(+)